MTVDELLSLLQDMADAGHGDCEVLFAYQKSYPLQDHIAGGWIPTPDTEQEDDDAAEQAVVYLVSGGQCQDQPYGPRRAFEEVSDSL